MSTVRIEREPDPEEILSTSLQTLYSYRPVVVSDAGSTFFYARPGDDTPTITLQTPDTHAKNWALHVSSIWMSSVYLADHLSELKLADALRRTYNDRGDGDRLDPRRRLEVLELGAGAGLPGILIAKHLAEITTDVSFPWKVTLSDYPDEKLIEALEMNVERNINADSKGACVVKAYAWGTDPAPLISDTCRNDASSTENLGFDLIIAADTLWNPESHIPFYNTLCSLLRKSPDARVYLVAGLHTGPYTIEGFLDIVKDGGLGIESVVEREVNGEEIREWIVDREDRDEVEKRRWVVWIILKWKTFH